MTLTLPTGDDRDPPIESPRVRLERPALAFIPAARSPKSCVLPKVEIVRKDIYALLPGDPKPPGKTARTPKPVFDPVPPPRFGVTNSN